MAPQICDFKGANCSLFRIPAVDFSKVEELINNKMLEAWQNNQNPQRVIDGLLSDSELTETMAPQIEEALKVRRKAELAVAKEQASQAVDQIHEEYGTSLSQAEEAYQRSVGDVSESVNNARQTLSEGEKTYTAAQASMQELRQKVESQLEDVGGKDGLESLLLINEAVNSADSIDKVRATVQPKITAHSDGNKPEKQGVLENTVPKITDQERLKYGSKYEEKLTRAAADYIQVQKKNQRARFWKRVWGVLNYELW